MTEIDGAAAQVVVGALGANSVDIVVRLWVKAEDYWVVRFDLTKAFKEAFDAAGITIPFPQREARIVEHRPDTGAAARA